MSVIGTVESLWRYPVKSMRGEELEEIFIGTGGVQGDRRFAFTSSLARTDFPYFTARQQHHMLQYRPGLSQPNERSIEIEAPGGATFAIDDPALIEELCVGLDAPHRLTLMRSDAAIADCHPISIISLQTAHRLADETGTAPEKRRFRANIYLDLADSAAFAEDEFVGRSLRIGESVVVAIVARDSRCVMINLHPDTATMEPALLKKVAQSHGGTAGVYGTVSVEGIVRKGDTVRLVEAAFL